MTINVEKLKWNSLLLFQDVFIALEELTAKTGYQDFTVRTSRGFSLRRELRWAASPLKETKMSNYSFKKVYQN